jgi:putative colanic acid biosynthesis UDP-glucose lipid carrier transferase
MTEPILYRRSFLIAAVTVVQTVLSSVTALTSLALILHHWNVSFSRSPASLAVIITLTFLLLIRPPRDLSTQLSASGTQTATSVCAQWSLLLAVLALLGYLTHSFDLIPEPVAIVWAIVTPMALVAMAILAQQIMRRMVMAASSNRRAIFAGYNDTSMVLARRLDGNSGLRLAVEGFFDDRGSDRLQLEPGLKLIGSLNELGAYVKQRGIDVIFIALPIRHLKRVMDLLEELRDTTASIYYVPDIFVFDLIQARSGELHGIPVVAMCETPFYGYRGVTKRLTDVVLSLVVLIAASPLFAVLALLVRLSSPGPVIFRQRRYGLDGREIIVYKFRTMNVTEDGLHVQQASRTDSRITPLGAVLRRLSLDELPQLVNVLQGRMSLVGPRPHAVAHNEEYRKLIKGYMVRHKVLPGITGLAQVNGCRGETSKLEEMEARVNYDLDYLRRWSPMLDLKILFQTFLKLFHDGKAY